MEDFTQVSLVIDTNSECPKGSVYLEITGIGRVISIWDEVFVKIRVYFDGLATRKEVFSEYNHRVEAHIDVVIEVLDI